MEQARTAPLSSKAQVEALFDSLALEYLRERERQFSFLSQKRVAIEFLGGARGRLLELGCGPAPMMPGLLALGYEVHGIDVSSEMIRRARQRMAGHPLEKRCKFSVGDAEQLEFPQASYDAVLCMGVLEYLPRYARALAEVSRVLKPGGIAVFALPNRASAYHVARGAYVTLHHAERRLRGRQARLPMAHNRCVPWKLDRELEIAGLRKAKSPAAPRRRTRPASMRGLRGGVSLHTTIVRAAMKDAATGCEASAGRV